VRLRLTSRADSELNEGVAPYAEIRHDLARRFLREAVRALQRAKKRPLEHGLYEGRPMRASYRRVLVRGAPYLAVFLLRTDEVVVVSIANTHRRPGHWETE
jgi:hypothetical protein